MTPQYLFQMSFLQKKFLFKSLFYECSGLKINVIKSEFLGLDQVEIARTIPTTRIVITLQLPLSLPLLILLSISLPHSSSSLLVFLLPVAVTGIVSINNIIIIIFILMINIVITLFVFIIIALSFITSIVFRCSTVVPPSKLRENILNETNTYRKIHDAKPLTVAESLDKAAQGYADELALLKKMVHSEKYSRPGQGENLVQKCSMVGECLSFHL